MKTVLHLQDKLWALIIGGDDRVVTAVSDVDILRGDKPYRKYAREVKRELDFDQWYQMLQDRLNRQDALFNETLSAQQVFHPSRHPLGITVGSFIKGFSWNAVIVEYFESPVTDYYGFRVMAAKNITRQQHRGENWDIGMENIILSTKEAFIEEYRYLLAEQENNIQEALELAELAS